MRIAILAPSRADSLALRSVVVPLCRSVECVVEGEPSSSLRDVDVVIAVGVCRAVCAPRGRLLVLSRVSEPSEVLSVVEGGAAQLLALPVDPRRLRLKLLNIALR